MLVKGHLLLKRTSFVVYHSIALAGGSAATINALDKFMGPTWGPPGSCRPQMGPMLAPSTLLSGASTAVGQLVYYRIGAPRPQTCDCHHCNHWCSSTLRCRAIIGQITYHKIRYISFKPYLEIDHSNDFLTRCRREKWPPIFLKISRQFRVMISISLY